MQMALPWRILVSLLIATLLISIIWLTSQFKEPPEINAMLFLLLFIIQIVFEVINYVQGRSFSITPPTTRLATVWVMLSSALIGTLLYAMLFFGFKYLDYWWYNSESPNLNHIKNALLVGAALALIFALVQIAYRLNRAHYYKLVENERFKNELIQANLTILNQQLDPHFLFNNFNTLYYLIDEDSNLAKRFLKNMSGIYRHIMQSHHHGLIDAGREYQVAVQYLDILSSRYDQALEVEERVNKKHLQDKMLPPLVLQQLLENIAKHNQIDPGNPLKITLKSDPETLTITNTLIPALNLVSTGYGLNNIIARYRHLSPRKIHIQKTSDQFIVQIPLLSKS